MPASRRRLRAALAVASALVIVGAGIQRPVSDEAVYEVASGLRCVVCQNLSVADSPSEMAAQMRGIVRERLAAGEKPEEVRQYFVDRYGEWILLAPRARGFNVIVWSVPIVSVVAGALIVAWRLYRWTRLPPTPPTVVDAVMRDRIRREMEGEG